MNKNYIRAYSYINSPENKNLEFYIKKVDNGFISNFLYNIKKNNIIKISKESWGNLIIDNIINCNNLWLISSGTGIGPYLSILDYYKYNNNIKKIILINSVKYLEDINYLNKINNIKKKLKYNFKFILTTTKEKTNKYLFGRIIKNFNKIKKILKLNIKYNDYFMLCGNPNMIDDMRNELLRLNINNKNIIFEKYWK